MNFLKNLMSNEKKFDGPVVMGDESVMAPKAHGTSETPVQQNLRYGCDPKLADRICNFNRHFAERSGYWETTNFLADASKSTGEIAFYDSNSGTPLFTAPRGRTFEQFVRESKGHGWPSFRDEEVNWDYVRILPDGECVSVDGTHLGTCAPSVSSAPARAAAASMHSWTPVCCPSRDAHCDRAQPSGLVR